jgi:hypothetical protein
MIKFTLYLASSELSFTPILLFKYIEEKKSKKRYDFNQNDESKSQSIESYLKDFKTRIP